MKPFKRILVPVDGSATSRAGLERAIGLAKAGRARLRLVHVVDENAVMQGIEPALNVGDLLDGLVEDGRKIVAESAAVARRRGVKADTVLYELHIGRVADRILREAAKWRADVIVMGTHGRGGLGRLVMGSDAESVVRESRVPVLLVKARAGGKRR
jgi:nucleotide-binding universal stress UspA family protein